MIPITHEYTDAIQAVEDILAVAVSHNASDIHIDPNPDMISIRVRIDGKIEAAGFININLHHELIARLKILAGARIDLHSIPQDGRWQAHISDAVYNIRISFMPTYHGENAVIRLLPIRPRSTISFSELGFIPDHVELMVRALKRTHGLILVTGPTGSGKTTTLHSCLSIKAKEPIQVITLEDPVEYEIPGVRQIHIHHQHGVTFASGLRAALRQDPDVIMVGEIRDQETAQVAIHTALTGHLVLSTLHTNSALEAIPRLIDMGVDPHVLASTLSLIIAQRLVRKICDLCNGDGCDTCRGTGFYGRSVIVEAYEPDEKIRELITKRVSTVTYVEYAYSQGWKTMLDDGKEKVEWGVTTEMEIMNTLQS